MHFTFAMVYGPIAAYLVELFPTEFDTPQCRFPIISETAGLAVLRRLSPHILSLSPEICLRASSIRSPLL